MTLRKGESYYFGDNLADLLEFLALYGQEAGYPRMSTVASPCPTCGNDVFSLGFSELVGVAERRCGACGTVGDAGDTGWRADIRVDMDEPVCECGGHDFQVACAQAHDEDAKAGGWFFRGLRCARCGLIASYADWEIHPECDTVILAFRLSDDGFGDDGEVAGLMELERQLNARMEEADLGHCEGHEIGKGYFVMFFDGDNADALYEVLIQSRQGKAWKGHAIKRYGPPGAKEVLIHW